MEIALREFPKLSSRMIAELCGVSAPTVSAVADTCKSFTPAATVTGSDGKQYPATRRTSVTFTPPEPEEIVLPRGLAPGVEIVRLVNADCRVDVATA